MTDTKICKHCGKQIHSQAQYCMYCMESQLEKVDVTPSGLQKKKKGRLLLPVVIIAVCILSFGLTVGFWQLFRPAFPETPEQLVSGSETSASETEYLMDVPLNTEDTPYVTDQPENTQGTIPQKADPQTPNKQAATTQNSSPTTPSKPTNNNPIQDSTPEKSPSVQNPTTENTSAPNEDPTEPTTTTPNCSHYYTKASCTTPMTCIYCGATRGTADSNAHNYVAQTTTVHHDEKGHYEDVTTSVKKTKYLCFYCGYNQGGFDTLDDVYVHMQSHSNKSDFNWVMSHSTYRTETREVWENVTQQQWVVDQEAYDETVITGYTCSVCNKTK